MGAITALAAGVVGMGLHRQLSQTGMHPDRATALAAVVSLAVFVLAALFVLVGPTPLWFGLLVGAVAALSVVRGEVL